MLKDVYVKDIEHLSLLNEGVVSVNDGLDEDSLRVLEFEVRTFVCRGHYEKGMQAILENFLTALQANREQKAVWISGFFGSGKSHLAKMLRTLWVNRTFSSGQRALDLASILKPEIKVLFKELEREGRKAGGLHAFSGTLKSGATDKVRLTTLGFLFQSLGLPEKVNQARFCLWLRDEGALDRIRTRIETSGKDWAKVVGNFFVAQDLHNAVAEELPDHFSGARDVQERLKLQFGLVDDVSNTELVDLFRQALSVKGTGPGTGFPLTLVVLDEIQQFIGQNDALSMAVQELVETLSKAFQGRILFVGTGQNALAGTSYLQKLMGRFPVPVNLSDTDVDTVVRENILKKKPSAEPELKALFSKHQGEVDRHLGGTPLAPQQHRDDGQWLVPDYPVLPARRRFWDQALKAADRTGTAYQLRNQLRMVFNAVKESQNFDLGYVVPGDYLYEQNATAFVETSALSRELLTLIEGFKASSSEDDRLKGRILSLCFLVGKVNESKAEEVIPCVPRTLEDLLISDLARAEDLRQKVGRLCDDLVREGHLLKTARGLAIQTREGQRWTQEFKRFTSDLANKPDEVNDRRRRELNRFAETRLGSLRPKHGQSNEDRSFARHFGFDPPARGEAAVWVRSGWETSEAAAVREARAAGPDSPLIVVFVPRQSENDVKRNVIDLMAAERTLESQGTGGSGPDAQQALNAMTTLKEQAEINLRRLWDEAVAEAKVWLGGGEAVELGLDLAAKVEDALQRILKRMYPEFGKGDDPRWAGVLEETLKHSVHGLSKLGYGGEVAQHPVCAEVLRRTQSALAWSEVRRHLLLPPYGWPKDTIDGALYTLWINGLVTVKRAGKDLGVNDVPRKDIGTLYVATETVHLTTGDKLKLRSLYQELGLSVASGQEGEHITEFWQRIQSLRAEAGGPPPWPAPAAPPWLAEGDALSGNALARAVADRKDAVLADLKAWTTQKDRLKERRVRWDQLVRLSGLARGLEGSAEVAAELEALVAQRSALAEPDPLPALTARLIDLLHAAVSQAWEAYERAYGAAKTRLEADPLWLRLGTDQRTALAQKSGMELAPRPDLSGPSTLVEGLAAVPLAAWADRALAWEGRADGVLRAAAALLEPTVQSVRVPRPQAALKTPADVDSWLKQVRDQLVDALGHGPVNPL